MPLKTTQTKLSASDFIASIKDPKRKATCKTLYALFKKITKENGSMWGSSIVGFGKFSYKRSDGELLEYFVIGISPRSSNITIYNISGYGDPKGDIFKFTSLEIPNIQC